jgi:transposase
MRPTGKRYTDDFKRMIIEVYNSGKPVREICSEYGITNPIIYRWLKNPPSSELQKPVIKINEGKLRKELLKLAGSVNTAPSDASISYKDGSIVKKSETVGLSMDIGNTAEVIKKQLQSNPWNVVRLNRSSAYEFKKEIPAVKIKDFDDIQQVLSVYSTEVPGSELKASIESAAKAINGIVISEASGSGSDKKVFSFIERLKAGNNSFENDNEGYDQVASTLYAALLSAGMPPDSITRVPHELTVDYIEPGLDAWISGNAGDLKFSNPFKHKIALFAQIEGNSVIVAVAGNTGDYKGKQELKTEVTQKFAPPAFYVENDTLKRGEKVLVNPGKEGIMVNIYRNEELIGTDKYEAEKQIIQIGPGTGIINSNDK